MEKVWKWCYNKNKYSRMFYMLITQSIRIPFYVFTRNPEKSKKIIFEHLNW